MLGRAARRRCPRGLRRGPQALLAVLVLLALVGLGSVLRAQRGARAAEPGIRRIPRSGRRDPVLPRPPVQNSLGAHGEAVRLQLEGEELRLQEESVRLHQINTYLSDRISLHRRLPERWNPLCVRGPRDPRGGGGGDPRASAPRLRSGGWGKQGLEGLGSFSGSHSKPRQSGSSTSPRSGRRAAPIDPEGRVPWAAR